MENLGVHYFTLSDVNSNCPIGSIRRYTLVGAELVAFISNWSKW